MKNTNLFNFQNGMSYALATLGFDNAIPYEPAKSNSNFLLVSETTISVINPDYYGNSNYSSYHTFAFGTEPLIENVVADNINYYMTNESYEIHVNSNNNIYKDAAYSDNSWFLIPLNLKNNLFKKLSIKFKVTWTGYIDNRKYLQIGVVNCDLEGNVILDRRSEKKDSTEIGDYYVEVDISDLDNIDYIAVFAGSPGYEILEMRLV